MLRGSILHAALQRFYARLPSAVPGADRVPRGERRGGGRPDAGVRDGRGRGRVAHRRGRPRPARARAGPQRDLEQLVRDEASSKSPFVPRHLEVSFRAFELEPGVVVSGKIDRVDGDPMGARGMVIDYKSGARPRPRRTFASATCSRFRSTCSSSVSSWGSSQSAASTCPSEGRRPRGMLRSGPDGVAGFSARLPRAGRVRRSVRTARRTAVGLVERIRAGDVRHDPQGAIARTGAISGACAANAVRAPVQTRSSRLRSTPAGASSSRPARGRARRPCSSSGSSGRWSTTARTSTRCS